MIFTKNRKLKYEDIVKILSNWSQRVQKWPLVDNRVAVWEQEMREKEMDRIIITEIEDKLIEY